MNKIKQLAGQTAIYGISTVVGRFLNFLLAPLYTYTLTSTAEYGVVNEMYAYSAFLFVVLSYGMETAYFRFAKDQQDKEKTFSNSFISLLFTSISFWVVILFFYKDMAGWIRYDQHPEYVLWFAFIIGFDVLSCIPFAKLRADNKAKKFAFIKLANIGINISLNLFFILLCPYLHEKNIFPAFVDLVYSGQIEVKYIFISNLIASGFQFVFLRKELSSIRWHIDIQFLKKMLKYALPLMIFGLAGIVNETIDRILIKFLLPENISMSYVGIYGACYKVSLVMTIFIQAYRYAAEPFFFAQSASKDAKKTYADLMNFFIIVVSFIFLITTLYLDDVFIKLIGPEYRVGKATIPILLLANLCLGVFYNLSIWYKLTNKTRYGAYIALIGAVITLGLNYILIPIMGYMGAAWTTLICYSVMMVISYFLGQKHYYVKYDLKKILIYVVASVGLFFVSKLLSIEQTSLRLLVHTALLMVYMFIIYKMEKETVLMIKSSLRRRIKR